MLRKSLILLILILFEGCASTHLFDRFNPEVSYKKYNALLIIANVPGMELQTRLEDGLSDALAQESSPVKSFQRNHAIFKETPLTNEEIEYLSKKYDCDGVVFIEMSTPQTKDYNINLGSTTTGTISPSLFGEYTYSSHTTQNSISGSITTFTATVDLVDLASGKISWHSEENVTTGMFGSWDQALNSFLQTVAQEMKQNVLN